MSKGKVRTISPQDAWSLVQQHPEALLIDVRSAMEYLFVGHPTGAINIAWIDEPTWKVNPDFAVEVRKLAYILPRNVLTPRSLTSLDQRPSQTVVLLPQHPNP